MRIRSSLVLAAIVLAFPIRAGAATTIQPGTFVDTEGVGCTLSFVFTDGTRTYIATAGHCAERDGARASVAGIGQFGTVVYRRHSGSDDVALIRVDADKAGAVSPSVRDVGVPTGYTTAAETSIGDLIVLTGNGLIFGDTSVTRTRRGVLAADDQGEYLAEIAAIFGDSGGPVVHAATGKALGIVSGISIPTLPPSTLVGTTVQRALVLFRENVNDQIRLVTA